MSGPVLVDAGKRSWLCSVHLSIQRRKPALPPQDEIPFFDVPWPCERRRSVPARREDMTSVLLPDQLYDEDAEQSDWISEYRRELRRIRDNLRVIEELKRRLPQHSAADRSSATIDSNYVPRSSAVNGSAAGSSAIKPSTTSSAVGVAAGVTKAHQHAPLPDAIVDWKDLPEDIVTIQGPIRFREAVTNIVLNTHSPL
ncbi:hypothetical protein HPB47_026392 [Ixodes persulcatus]|uniref:Uncharacterized protein n=1 Tax=Ixodes persulcatus TaxID=34615 RepID=A0AC60Q0U2_IXOPE|nr:hypothetical protein HPB47_026392 [Ixodes persulcatus]